MLCDTPHMLRVFARKRASVLGMRVPVHYPKIFAPAEHGAWHVLCNCGWSMAAPTRKAAQQSADAHIARGFDTNA